MGDADLSGKSKKGLVKERDQLEEDLSMCAVSGFATFADCKHARAKIIQCIKMKEREIRDKERE